MSGGERSRGTLASPNGWRAWQGQIIGKVQRGIMSPGAYLATRAAVEKKGVRSLEGEGEEAWSLVL